VAIVMPVFDDWTAASIVCQQLDAALRSLEHVVISVYLIDDGSFEKPPPELVREPLRSISSITRVRLRRNVGHQRAIALGLAFVHDRRDADAVLVMDADGEDKPEDAARLIQLYASSGRDRAIFAARRRRLVGPIFSAGYQLYRLCHRLLTGIPVEIGNFSILPIDLAGRVVNTSEVWRHYSASVVKSQLPMTTVPMDRGQRRAGHSTMTYVKLVTHGLSAISVFGEAVGTRLFLGSALVAALGGLVLIALTVFAVAGYLQFDWRIAVVAALVVIIILQMLAAGFALAFSVLAGRDHFSSLPARDYAYFVDGITPLHARE
jgi:hypothetical protein